jgi:ribosome-associated protein
MIRVNAQIELDEREIQEDFVRASGPGGQNVNKVSTAVQLRFDVARSPSLPEPVRARLIALAGRRVTQDGVLIIEAERFRSQRRNRDDALERLIELIREACEVDKPRRPTRPTLASKKRRLDSKLRRGETKKLRGLKPGSDS